MWLNDTSLHGVLMVRIYTCSACYIVYNNYVYIPFLQQELNKLVKRLDKRAEKEEKKTPSNARTALKKRVDSTPSLIGPPEDAPAWTVAGSSSINTTPSATIPNESPLTTPDQNSGTPEAPPRTGPVNPRRLVRREAFKDYYQSDSSSLESELD